MPQDDRDEALSALAARWQAGDVSALEEIYQMTSVAVAGYLRRWMPWPDVDDLVQEAYLRLIDARQTYRPGRAFRPWLFAIVRHTALDARRARRRRERHAGEAATELAQGWPAEEHVDGVRVAEALRSLPHAQREVVWLARVEGMTSREIAAVVGASPGAVKVRLHRATERLRELFRTSSRVAGGGR